MFSTQLIKKSIYLNIMLTLEKKFFLLLKKVIYYFKIISYLQLS